MQEESVPKKSRSGRRIIVFVAGFLVLCCFGLIVFSLIFSDTPAGEAALTRNAEREAATESENTAEAVAEATQEAEDEEASTAEAVSDATQSASDAATEAARPTDLPTDTPEPTDTPKPTSTPEPDGLSREAAVPPGEILTVGDFDISIDHVILPSAAFMDAGNIFNPKPEDGKVIVMVYLALNCTADSSNTCNLSWTDFKLSGSAGIIYDALFGIVGIDDGLESLEILGGTEVVRWVAFEAEEGETGFILACEPFLSLDKAFFLLPEAVEE